MSAAWREMLEHCQKCDVTYFNFCSLWISSDNIKQLYFNPLTSSSQKIITKTKPDVMTPKKKKNEDANM